MNKITVFNNYLKVAQMHSFWSQQNIHALKSSNSHGMEVEASYPSALEAEAEGLQEVQAQPYLHSDPGQIGLNKKQKYTKK